MAIELVLGADTLELRELFTGASAHDAQEYSPAEAVSNDLFSGLDVPAVRLVRNVEKWTAAQKKQMLRMASEPVDVHVVCCAATLSERDPLRGLPTRDLRVPDEDRAEWVRQRLARLGCQADSSVCELISGSIKHPDAVKSFIRAVGAMEQLTLDHARALLDEPGRSGNTFAYTDALLDGDPQAGRHLARLIADDASPFMILGAVRSALLAASWTALGLTAEAMGVKPYPFRKASARSRRLGSHGLGEALRVLAETDIALKGGSKLDDRLVLWQAHHRLRAVLA